MRPIFITGIGTAVGKTIVSAIVTEALQACYWKPVQAGYAEGTDSEWVGRVISKPEGRIYPEAYKLALPASPHIAAREEGLRIDLEEIATRLPVGGGTLVIEGAGGLLVPLNEKEFVLDLALKLDATLILVSRNYLGSINHSLLTAAACKSGRLRVAGWIFNDQYMHYEREIVAWTGIPLIASIPYSEKPGPEFIREQAQKIGACLRQALQKAG